MLLYIALGVTFSFIYQFLLKAENTRRDRGERDEVIGEAKNGGQYDRNGIFESVEEAKAEKGDDWSGYRYTL